MTIAGLDQVPHDLWAAADLPPMSLVDRLTLIAIQFDLTFTIAADGAQVELVPVPQNLPMPVGERQRPILPQTAAKRPAVDPAGVPRGPIKGLTIQEKPLGPVLRQLAKELDLQLKMNEKAIHAAGISLDQRVSLTVENATVDEVFRKLLERTGLTFRRFQNVVEIRPAQE